jgi:hypothetical protein
MKPRRPSRLKLAWHISMLTVGLLALLYWGGVALCLIDNPLPADQAEKQFLALAQAVSFIGVGLWEVHKHRAAYRLWAEFN